MLAMGRLAHEKGFDFLLNAYARLAEEYPDWDLWIWGDGPERATLEIQVTALGLAGRVFLPGRTKQPWDEMEKADIFVLPSRFEGFGMVMLEAMGLGTPVIAFDCPSGPREVSRNGQPPQDADALAVAMARIMNDRDERVRLG